MLLIRSWVSAFAAGREADGIDGVGRGWRRRRRARVRELEKERGIRCQLFRVGEEEEVQGEGGRVLGVS